MTANPQNCSVKGWYYIINGDKRNLNKTETQLIVNHANTALFPGNATSVIIGIEANEGGLFDEVSIAKVYQGAAGDSAVVAVLSNESTVIGFNADDEPVTNAYADAKTTLTVYDGNDNVTSSCTITAVPDTGIVGSWDSTTFTYTVSSISTSGKV